MYASYNGMLPVPFDGNVADALSGNCEEWDFRNPSNGTKREVGGESTE